MHLPLTPIDSINQPPESYLIVQDSLTLFSGGLWAIAYILYVQQAFRDESYGMPIFALCANLTWELLYGLIYSPGWAEFVVFFPGFLVDICLVYVTLKFGPREWQQSPLVAANLGIVMTVGTLMTLGAHLAALDMFTDYTEASFWSAYVCQTTLSWYSIAQLLSRGSTKGHSMAIWWCRFLGTFCATAVFQWRYYHYPDNYAYVGMPISRFLVIAPEFADLAYPFLYWYVEKLETGKFKQG